jgi:hypothetical protein
MMEMGGHVANGFALGIDGQGQSATRAARRMATGVAAAGALSLSPALATPGTANRQGHPPLPDHHPRPRRARHGYQGPRPRGAARAGGGAGRSPAVAL